MLHCTAVDKWVKPAATAALCISRDFAINDCPMPNGGKLARYTLVFWDIMGTLNHGFRYVKRLGCGTFGTRAPTSITLAHAADFLVVPAAEKDGKNATYAVFNGVRGGHDSLQDGAYSVNDVDSSAFFDLLWAAI